MKKYLIKYFLVFFLLIVLLGGSGFFYFKFQKGKKIEKLSSFFSKIEIQIADQKCNPTVFKIKAKEMVVLSIISMDGKGFFKFQTDTPSLNWIQAQFKEAGETRQFTFYAPSETGEYRFLCSSERDGEGVMIVGE